MSRVYIISVLSIFIFMACKEAPKENLCKEVQLLVDSKSSLGEGALWDYKSQHLLWINIDSGFLNVYNPITKQNQRHQLPSMVGTVVPINHENVLVALQDGVYKYNMKNQQLNKVASPEPADNTNRFNDGKCDPAGRLWVGSLSLTGQQKAAFLHKINADYTVQTMIEGVGISNGIVWSADKKKMYFIDTPTKKVVQYDFDVQLGSIANPQTVIEISDSLGYPDGSTIDENGNIWIGMWAGSSVTCWNPNTGKLLDRIMIPAQNVTSCAFGGKNLDQLFITTARKGTNKEGLKRYPSAGGLFIVKPGVKGVKAFYFKEESK